MALSFSLQCLSQTPRERGVWYRVLLDHKRGKSKPLTVGRHTLAPVCSGKGPATRSARRAAVESPQGRRARTSGVEGVEMKENVARRQALGLFMQERGRRTPDGHHVLAECPRCGALEAEFDAVRLPGGVYRVVCRHCANIVKAAA
jgi:hypothetical protein